MGIMIDYIGKPAMLEALAEESTELAKAALKYARIIRKENPTPVTEEQAKKDLVEEFTDVMNCIEELGIEVDPKIKKEKYDRFEKRRDEDIEKKKESSEKNHKSYTHILDEDSGSGVNRNGREYDKSIIEKIFDDILDPFRVDTEIIIKHEHDNKHTSMDNDLEDDLDFSDIDDFREYVYDLLRKSNRRN